MSIIAKGGSSEKYPLIPAGTYNAVCVDVVDEGEKESNFDGKKKMQRKVSVWWQLDEERPDKAERFSVRKWYTLSLNEKSSLTADLVAWRGKPFTPEELDGFDLEKLIGVPAMVTIVHKPSADGTRTYANVAGVASPPKKMPKLEVENYIRRKDREDAKYDQAREADMAEQVGPDMEIPF